MKVKYKFKKTIGGPIQMNEAEEWMARYKAKNPKGPWAYFFGEDLIRKIIDHPEAVGMRVYLGLNKEDRIQMVLIGAREDGTNILGSMGKDMDPGVAGDNGYPCPPYC